MWANSTLLKWQKSSLHPQPRFEPLTLPASFLSTDHIAVLWHCWSLKISYLPKWLIPKWRAPLQRRGRRPRRGRRWASRRPEGRSDPTTDRRTPDRVGKGIRWPGDSRRRRTGWKCTSWSWPGTRSGGCWSPRWGSKCELKSMVWFLPWELVVTGSHPVFRRSYDFWQCIACFGIKLTKPSLKGNSY